MGFPWIPDRVFPDVFQLTPELLEQNGIRLILADLDNTLIPYSAVLPTPELHSWKAALEERGIRLFLLSNSRRPNRPRIFADAFGIPFLGHAGKPKTGGFRRAMEQMGCRQAETVIVGDQIFTDVWGGHRAGIRSFLVEPIRLAGNPGRYLRYWAETPFRLLGRKNNRKQGAEA